MNTINKQRYDQLLQNNITVIDVRSPVEFNKKKYIQTAINVPVYRVSDLYTKFKKTDPILLISKNKLDKDLHIMYNYLIQIGYTKVYAYGCEE
jgi:rhodanese-related sulfurtransferase